MVAGKQNVVEQEAGMPSGVPGGWNSGNVPDLVSAVEHAVDVVIDSSRTQPQKGFCQIRPFFFRNAAAVKQSFQRLQRKSKIVFRVSYHLIVVPMDAAFNRGIVKQRQPADVIQMRMSQKNAANVRRAKMYAELRLNRVEAVENILP